MRKLIQGIVDFRQNLTDESRALFAKLALGQKPDALFIACSDSRVVPNLFASTNPGDVFVLRNIGNLIPPAPAANQETGVASVLEFSLLSLNVSDIIVCGHSECGAIRALTETVETDCCPHLKSWLQYGEEAVRKVQEGFVLDPSLSRQNQISQVNVLQQMEHLLTYSFIRERVNQGTLRIHGWWFDIAHADVYCYEASRRQFIVIDEAEAREILKRF